jgi:hypothetical protein
MRAGEAVGHGSWHREVEEGQFKRKLTSSDERLCAYVRDISPCIWPFKFSPQLRELRFDMLLEYWNT